MEYVLYLYAVWALGLWSYLASKALFKWSIKKAARKKQFENDILSVFYFITEMGPNVSSFAVIALFITSNETFISLIVVFIVGIMMKHFGRKIRNKFMDKVREEKELWS